MHETVKNALKEGVDETVAAEALQRKSGWMHIQGAFSMQSCLVYLFDVSGLDERNIPALGRVGDPDDILASVMVENGKVSNFYLSITLFLECSLIVMIDTSGNLSNHAFVPNIHS